MRRNSRLSRLEQVTKQVKSGIRLPEITTIEVYYAGADGASETLHERYDYDAETKKYKVTYHAEKQTE